MTDLIVKQGETYTAAYPVIDAAGAPVFVTGWAGRMQVRARPDSPAVLHEWTTDNNTLTCVGTTVSLTVPPVVSDTWAWDDGHYDIELTNPAGAVARVAAGRLYVLAQITR